MPRTGGSLGLTYIPPSNEDRALMFEPEIRGNLAMLMGGRAAEEVGTPGAPPSTSFAPCLLLPRCGRSSRKRRALPLFRCS